VHHPLIYSSFATAHGARIRTPHQRQGRVASRGCQEERRPGRACVKEMAGGSAGLAQGGASGGLCPGGVRERRELLEIGGRRRGRRLPAYHGGALGSWLAGGSGCLPGSDWEEGEED